MRILRQVSVLFLICLVCEGIAALLPVPIPGSVLSMVVLFALFALKILKPADLKETSALLLGNMMLVFLPSLVSILNYVDVLQSILWRFVLVIVVSTAVTFLVGGGVVTLVSRLMARREGKEG